MKIECRKCFEKDIQDGEFERIVSEYTDSLDPEIKCDDFVYRKRISLCDECDALINGLCKYCGCFVLARAVKKNLMCPYPGSNKWEILK